MKKLDIKRLSGKYEVRKLEEADIGLVYGLSAGNPMFFQYCPPFVTKESILHDMKALPPGTSYEDKYYVGFFHEGRLLAVLDLIFHYPNEETAFIGLFMMRKESQGKGIGSAVITECFDFIKAQGYRFVRLGFAKGNPQSEAFWTKNGFAKTGVEAENENYTMVVMEKEL